MPSYYKKFKEQKEGFIMNDYKLIDKQKNNLNELILPLFGCLFIISLFMGLINYGDILNKMILF